MSGRRKTGTCCRNRKRGHPLNTNHSEVPLTPPRAKDWLARFSFCGLSMVLTLALVPGARAQQPLTWDQAKAKFEAVNPALKADRSEERRVGKEGRARWS